LFNFLITKMYGVTGVPWCLGIAGCVVYMVVEVLWGWSGVFRLEFLSSFVFVYFEFSMLCVDLFMSSFYIYCPVVFC
jgi:hypothetical protein